jgi:hypothetical protein
MALCGIRPWIQTRCQRIAPGLKLVISEVHSPTDARALELSTSGLPEALDRLRKRSDEREDFRVDH